MVWQINPCTDYIKRCKDFGKKYPHEVRAVGRNLVTMVSALENGAKPEQVKSFGFIHGNYDYGIVSIDETGHDKPSKPKALRLYAYACEDEQVVYAMLLGEKDGQQNDVKLCKRFVSEKIKEIAAKKATAPKPTVEIVKE